MSLQGQAFLHLVQRVFAFTWQLLLWTDLLPRCPSEEA